MPENVVMPLNTNLYNAIIYRYKQNESYQVAIEEILVSLVSFIFDRDYSLDFGTKKKLYLLSKGNI